MNVADEEKRDREKETNGFYCVAENDDNNNNPSKLFQSLEMIQSLTQNTGLDCSNARRPSVKGIIINQLTLVLSYVKPKNIFRLSDRTRVSREKTAQPFELVKLCHKNKRSLFLKLQIEPE